MLLLALSGIYTGYYVSNNRDVFKDLLVEQVNELTVGKWSVDSLSIDIWESYPYVVVNLHNLRLYEDSLALKANDDILEVNNAWFRADIPSLIRKKLNVNHIGFDGVTANLKKENGCDFNLIEALKLNKKIVIDNQVLSFNIEKIAISQMNINLSSNKFSTKKPLLVDRFTASVGHKGKTVDLSDCSLECYGLKFFLDLKYHIARRSMAVDFSSSSRLLKFKGDVNFSETSIITVKSKVESSIPLSEYSNDKMRGDLFVKGVMDFDFDMLTYRMIEDRCRLKFGINDVFYNHTIEYMPKIVFHSGVVEYSGSSIIGDQIIVGVGTNKMEINFLTSSIADLLNKVNNYDIALSVDVKSSDFNPYIIKERLGMVADSLSNENSIKDLSIRLHTNITPKNMPMQLLSDNKTFGVTIDNYSAKLNNDISVSDFSGELAVENGTIFLRDFKGLINDSRTTLYSQIVIKTQENSELFDRVDVKADLNTSHIYPNEFGIIGTKVALNDVKSSLTVEIKPNKDRQAEHLENINIKFNTFNATIDGKPFSQRSTIVKNGDKIEILNANLEYDKERFEISGSLYAESQNKADTLNIKTDNFDFKRLVNDKTTGNTELPKVQMPIVINLNVGRFIMLDQQLNNLKGVVCIEKDRSLLFKDVNCLVAGGEINFSGKLTQRANELEIKSNVKYRNIDFENLNVKYKISKSDNERYVNENLRGRISGTMNAELFVDKDLNVDTKRSIVDADFTITNGRLVDFAPIKAASKYFQRSNLNDIKFDTLSNHITIKSGVISVPRMNIASTLGNYFVSGTTSIDDGKMNFMIEVPWNVIGGAVAGRLFGGRDRDNEEIDDNIKKRYVKFYVVGTSETYEIKLRNRGDEKGDK